MVLHNNLLANPIDPKTVVFKKLTGKKKKVEADHLEIRKLEFLAGLYMDDNGPCIPVGNLRKMLVEGGKLDRNGKLFESGLMVESTGSIEYDGPRDAEGLYKTGAWPEGFVWSTAVGNQKSTIIRTRPRFEKWSVTFKCWLNDAILDEDIFRLSLDRAQRQVGICDARVLGLGRFSAEVLDVEAS